MLKRIYQFPGLQASFVTSNWGEQRILETTDALPEYKINIIVLLGTHTMVNSYGLHYTVAGWYGALGGCRRRISHGGSTCAFELYKLG